MDEELNRKALRLYEALVSGLTPDALAEMAAALFSHPLAAADMGCRLLCAAGLPEAGDKGLLSRLRRDGFFPTDFLRAFSETADSGNPYRSFLTACGPTQLEDQLSGETLLLYRMGEPTAPTGFAVLFGQGRPFSDEERALLPVLARVLNRALWGGGAAEPQRQRACEYVIAEILDGRLSGDQLNQRLLAVNVEPKRSRMLLVFEAAEGGEAALARSGVESILPGCICMSYHGRLLALMELGGGRPIPLERLQRLNAFQEANRLNAGCSNAFEAMSSLPAVYAQASAAMRIGRQLGEKRPIHHLWEYATYHMCDLLRGSSDLMSFCHPMPARIQAYDKRRGTSYLETLRVYITCGNDARTTARTLHVHRNTVDYRLARIRELFQLDVEDPNILFAIRQTIQILQYLTHNDVGGEKLP